MAFIYLMEHLLICLRYRFSRDRPRFTDTLDVIKFLCKDLWMLVFRKQIDNLKTNHRVRRPLSAPEYVSRTQPSELYDLTIY